jgi:hypothetical protein
MSFRLAIASPQRTASMERLSIPTAAASIFNRSASAGWRLETKAGNARAPRPSGSSPVAISGITLRLPGQNIRTHANAALHDLASHPLLRHVAGDLAGATIAARRMMVLARATAAPCDPVTAGDLIAEFSSSQSYRHRVLCRIIAPLQRFGD